MMIFIKFPLQLDVIHLSKDPIPVTGNYVNSDAAGLPSRLSVEYDALERLVFLFVNFIFIYFCFYILLFLSVLIVFLSYVQYHHEPGVLIAAF